MITFDKLQELIDLLDEAPGVTEITINIPGSEQVSIKKQPSFASSTEHDAQYPSSAAPQYATSVTVSQEQIDGDSELSEPDHVQKSAKMKSIDANRVGIFHTAKPRIDIGDNITVGQIVGFIESIKLMNEIRSEFAGKLAAQLLDDGTPVEYGQQLYSLQTTEE